MSEIWFGIGYVLAVSTIVAGLALLAWHVWDLASRLRNNRTDSLSLSSRHRAQTRVNERRQQNIEKER